MNSANDNFLKCTYTYWFNSYDKNKLYNQSLLKISEFDTIEKFWNVFNSLSLPCELNIHADCLIFKTGITPIWEDPANISGGKWILRLKKSLASRVWEKLVLAMLSEQFEVNDDICGVVASVRGQEDILSVWNKSRNDETIKNKIRETMFRVLDLPSNIVIEYKEHANSIKDSSSYYNTIIHPTTKEA